MQNTKQNSSCSSGVKCSILVPANVLLLSFLVNNRNNKNKNNIPNTTSSITITTATTTDSYNVRRFKYELINADLNMWSYLAHAVWPFANMMTSL